MRGEPERLTPGTFTCHAAAITCIIRKTKTVTEAPQLSYLNKQWLCRALLGACGERRHKWLSVFEARISGRKQRIFPSSSHARMFHVHLTRARYIESASQTRIQMSILLYGNFMSRTRGIARHTFDFASELSLHAKAERA